jgi:hypothetical protein
LIFTADTSATKGPERRRLSFHSPFRRNHELYVSGFKNVSGLVHDGVPQQVFLAMSFDGQIPQGTVNFHDGFKADGQ